MSLMKEIIGHPAGLPIAWKYTAMNGLVYLGSGALMIIWPGVVQTVFKNEALVGNEAALIRVLGMAVAVIS